MHHKRGKKKSARAGCSMCKPHKDNEFKDTYEAQTNQEKLARDDFEDQMNYVYSYGPEKELGDSRGPCPACKGKIRYAEVFDSFYCEECKEWLDSKCGDEYCHFCNSRPEKAP